MSFADQESSLQDGVPVAYYEFKWGNTYWRYTSADRDMILTVVGDEIVYEAIPISDSGMVQGGSSNNDITVDLPASLPLIDLFHSTPPSDEIRLTIRRKHYGDPDDEAVIYWSGFVQNVKRSEGNVSAKVIGVSIMAMFQSKGLRLAWTRGCPHILYDSECRVDPALFAVETTIVAMTGNDISVADAGGHALGYFTGGYIEWTANADGTLDRRGISDSIDPLRFVLLGTTYRLEVGQTVRLYPGCDLTTATCSEKFSNLVNYGGIEQMTGVNPFDGTPIV